MLVLSDRAIGPDRVPVSALLACGAVHHHLVSHAKRTRIGIVLETGEAREVHHHCLLVGYGADGINPYLAFEALAQSREDGLLDADTDLVGDYRQAVAKGMLKVMAKMGISTLQSYKGGQIFEALGLADDVIDTLLRRHREPASGRELPRPRAGDAAASRARLPARSAGRAAVAAEPGRVPLAQRRREARLGSCRPSSRCRSRRGAAIATRIASSRRTSTRKRARTARCAACSSSRPAPPSQLDDVEPASEIVKRFVTGAMSFGSLSTEAHETLAIAMNRIGGKSNTGEGGEDPARFVPLPNGDSRRSAIKQIASGRFGVTIGYLANADELQIKMAQGAKPGEGGELPGKKVDDNIARIRYSTPGVGLISPPPHHDIYSIEDLAQLIHDLKNANPSARISVKLVSEVGVGTIAAGVVKAHADHVLVSGDNGGTGASPLTSIKHAGLPWELGVAETHQTLVMNDLRSRAVLQTDGGIKTGRDVVIAALLGAEEMGFSTAPLIALGCIMMRKCHLNTCPVGVATQDPVLRKRFAGQPEHVVNYLFMVAEEAREIMASLGVRRFLDLVGRVDLLQPRAAINHWKADGLDLTPLLTPAPKPRPNTDVYCTKQQDHRLNLALDNKLIALAKKSIQQRKKTRAELDISNTNRTVGAMLSYEVVKKWGADALPYDTVRFKFSGHSWPELRRVPREGHHARARGRQQRLRRQGLVGRPHHHLSAARGHVRGRRQRADRQRRAVRRDERPRVLPRPLRGAVLRPQLGC